MEHEQSSLMIIARNHLREQGPNGPTPTKKKTSEILIVLHQQMIVLADLNKKTIVIKLSRNFDKSISDFLEKFVEILEMR